MADDIASDEFMDVNLEGQLVYSVLLGKEFVETNEKDEAVTNTSAGVKSSDKSNLKHIKRYAGSLHNKLLTLPNVDYFRIKYDRLSRMVIGEKNTEEKRQCLWLRRISLELEFLEPYVCALRRDMKDMTETLNIINDFNQDPETLNSASDTNDQDCIAVQGSKVCDIAVDQSKQYPPLDGSVDQDELFCSSMNLVLVNQGQGHLRKGKDLVRILTKSSPNKKEIFGAQSLEDEKIETRKKNVRERMKRQRASWSPTRKKKEKERKKRYRASWSPQRKAVELEKSRERWSRYHMKKISKSSSLKSNGSTTDRSWNARNQEVYKINKGLQQDATTEQQTDDSLNFEHDTERVVCDKENDGKTLSQNQRTAQNCHQKSKIEPLKGKSSNFINCHDDPKLSEEASQSYSQDLQLLQANRISSKTPVQEEQRIAKPESYKCDICRISFKTQSILDRHISKHKGQGYGCETCGQFFEMAKSLKKHRMERHKNLFTCSFCPRRFNYAESLNDHMNKHKGLKPYECDLCNEKCYSYTDLRTHKDAEHYNCFTCKVCGMKFRSKSAINTHYHSHSQKDLSKNLITLDTRICDFCGFVTRRTYLYRHMKLKHPSLFGEETSNKYICGTCGKVSDNSVRHKNHMRYHRYPN